MSFFNLFNKDNESQNAANLAMLPATESPAPSAEEDSSPTSDEAQEQTSNESFTVSYATGWPIDVIYGYLHKNYEDKGYNDAMLMSDPTFRNLNMKIISNKILMVFRETNLKYDVMQNDIETRIENCSTAGLLTTVAELKSQIAIIAAHKQELQRLEQDFTNNANEASVPLQSYDCGFRRGIATIALSGSPTSQMTPTPVHQARATA